MPRENCGCPCAGNRCEWLIEFDPAVFVPIAAPFVLPPAISVMLVITPFPIVGMYRNPEIGVVIMPL